MRLHRAPAPRRGGFTLIEMMVVILIIAVLVSLLSSAVFQAFVKVDEVKTRHEMGQMAGGLKQFESAFNITTPPPSRLWLDKQGTYATPPVGYNASQMGALSQLGTDSQAYLRQVWPQLWRGGAVDWNGDGNLNEGFILEGEQVLVFFLGGAKSGGVFVGFSGTNATNPMDTSNLAKRNGPYFLFDMNRIQAGANNFPAYADTYGTAYAYFSSGKGQNSYDAYFSTLGVHDCNSLTQMAPYFNGNQYYNPDTFQIISAGRDKNFGPGGQWTSADGAGMAPGGMDNITNFYDAKLGTTP